MLGPTPRSMRAIAPRTCAALLSCQLSAAPEGGQALPG